MTIVSIGPGQGTGLPDINVDDTPRFAQIDLVRDALVSSNVPTQVHFVYGGRLAKIDCGTSKPVVVPVEIAALTEFAMRQFDWTRPKKKGSTHVDPPPTVIRAVAATPGDGLPELWGIADVPFFVPSGRVVATSGYDVETKVYLHLAQPFEPVPNAPGDDEFEAAVNLLVVDALQGFMFADAASKANAIAASLTKDVMSLYPDLLTPVFASDAPENNYGKTTLVQSIMAPLAGHSPDVTPMTMTDGPECRRTLYALLKDKPNSIILDNIASRVAGDALASLLTARRTKDRVIKTSTSPTVENTTLWFATGKNLNFSTEMRLRAVLMQLVAPPVGNRNPITWAIENRYAIIRARITVILRWIACGRPLASVTHPKYPGWAEVVGGILDVMGVADFLGNQHRLAARDDEAAAWDDLVDRWAGLQPGPAQRRRVKEIIAGAAIPGEPAWDVVADGREEDSRAKILGHALRDRVDRAAIAGWVIRSAKNTHGKVHEYWLEPAVFLGSPPPGSVPSPQSVMVPSPATVSTTPTMLPAPTRGVCGVPAPAVTSPPRDAPVRAQASDPDHQNPANPALPSDARPGEELLLVDRVERYRDGVKINVVVLAGAREGDETEVAYSMADRGRLLHLIQACGVTVDPAGRFAASALRGRQFVARSTPHGWVHERAVKTVVASNDEVEHTEEKKS